MAGSMQHPFMVRVHEPQSFESRAGNRSLRCKIALATYGAWLSKSALDGMLRRQTAWLAVREMYTRPSVYMLSVADCCIPGRSTRDTTARDRFITVPLPAWLGMTLTLASEYEKPTRADVTPPRVTAMCIHERYVLSRAKNVLGSMRTGILSRQAAAQVCDSGVTPSFITL